MDYSLIRKVALDCFKIDWIDYKQTKILTTAHDNDRSLFYNGKYYSPLISTIEDDLSARGVECVSVARIISRIKGRFSHGYVRSPDGRFARALLVKRLIRLFSRGRYPYSKMEEVTWGKILDVTRARKVFGIQPSREMCVACHKRGIWVADVQHGVIAHNHLWYGKKFRAHDPLEYLPSAFLCWDFGSKEVIDVWAKERGISVRAIGNRWVARFSRRSQSDQLVNELFQRFESENQHKEQRETILISLSWGDYNIPNGFICEGLEAVIRKTAHKYRWYLRLHPNQIKGFATHESVKFFKYFKERLEGFAEWEVPTKHPLPVVLKSVNLNISWMSSTCIEAAQLGVKSALLNPRLRSADEIGDYYEYYRRTGMVDLVEESAGAIENWIERSMPCKQDAENYEAYDGAYRSLLDELTE